MLKIITDVEKLRGKNETVSLNEGKEIIRILESVLKTGLGLAAPQVGIHKRVAIVRAEDKIDFINPVILSAEDPFTNFREGCLSIPNKRFNTKRFGEIFVKDDLHPDGVIITGGAAIVAFHEIDHLSGILVMDRSVGKSKIGRNDPCPCGKLVNNKPIKWKKCHGRY